MDSMRDGDQPQGDQDGSGNAPWNESDWSGYLRRNDLEVGRFLSYYHEVRKLPDRLDRSNRSYWAYRPHRVDRRDWSYRPDWTNRGAGYSRQHWSYRQQWSHRCYRPCGTTRSRWCIRLLGFFLE